MIKTINAQFDCRGYYLRWYFNGWHHYFFKVADEIQQTEGQKYQTQMSTKLVVGDDNIRKNQMLAFTGLMRSKHIFMLTEDGWKACTIVDTDLPYGRADHPGARVEFTLNVWAKKGLFTPLLEVEVRPFVPPEGEYGDLYNFAITERTGVNSLTSSDTWRVPTSIDMNATKNHLINTYADINALNVGNYMKSCRQVDSPLGGDCDTSEQPRWNADATHYGNNEFNLSILPNGFRLFNGSFFNIGQWGTWWSQTPDVGDDSTALTLYHDLGEADVAQFDKGYGLAIRLVRDATSADDLIEDGGFKPNDYIGNNLFTYWSVRIGDLFWMIANLKEVQYRNGDPIPLVQGNAAWAALVDGGRCQYPI